MGFDVTGLGSVFDFGSKIIDKIWPDPAKRDEAKLELFKAQQAGQFKELDQAFELAKAQIDVNKEEAKSSNVFISGWRPNIGWIGGFGLLYVSIVEPASRFVATVFYHYTGPFPTIDTTVTLQVLMAILGLGGMRSYEKMKGVAS